MLLAGGKWDLLGILGLDLVDHDSYDFVFCYVNKCPTLLLGGGIYHGYKIRFCRS